MRHKEEPQISDNQLIPVLDLDEIDKGRKIYKTNDQKEVHWQLNALKVKGIDNSKSVLIVTDSLGKPAVIPFSDLDQYFVMKHGWQPLDKIGVKFHVLGYKEELSRKDKYQLLDYARTIPDASEKVYEKKVKFKKNGKFYFTSAPNAFHKWMDTHSVIAKTIFEDMMPYGNQELWFDMDENIPKIFFRKKYYTLEAWADKINL